jgi:hypothetical protein
LDAHNSSNCASFAKFNDVKAALSSSIASTFECKAQTDLSKKNAIFAFTKKNIV